MAGNLRADIQSYEEENKTKVKGPYLASYEVHVLSNVVPGVFQGEEIYYG